VAASNGAYGNLALLYLHEKRYAEAAAASEKAIALNDQEIQSWRFAELAYRWLGERQKAEAGLNRIQSLAEAQAAMNPRNAASQSWLGLVYAKKGLRERAIPHIEAALSLASEDQGVLVNAVEAYHHRGDVTSAERIIRKARQYGASLADLQLDPDMQSLLAKEKTQ
jgi:tetratricopeptide (TPR) repeat protein